MASREPESCKVHNDKEETHICTACWQAQCSECLVSLVSETGRTTDGHIHQIMEIEEAIPLADKELEKACKLITHKLKVKKDSKLSRVLGDLELAIESDYRYRLSALRGILRYQKKYGSFDSSSRSSTTQHLCYKDQPRTQAKPPMSNAGVHTHQASAASTKQHLCYKDQPRTQPHPTMLIAGMPTHQTSTASSSQNLCYKDQPRTQANPPKLNIGAPTRQSATASSSQHLSYKDQPRTQDLPTKMNVVAPTVAAWTSVSMSIGTGDRASSSKHYRRIAEASSRVQRGSLAPTAEAWTALGMSAGQGDTTSSSRKRPSEDDDKSSRKRRA